MIEIVFLLVPLLALVLDAILGEPKKFHPLVGFGLVAKKIEKKLNLNHQENSSQTFVQINKVFGAIAWLLLCMPIPLFLYWLELQLNQQAIIILLVDLVVVCFAIALNSLTQHAKNIFQPLQQNNIQQARSALSFIVSRDTQNLSEQAISKATVESIFENGHDAVLATLFWYMIGGAPMVLLHRLANTLDAMWGYKNQRYIYFGFFSAKMDDLLGLPTALLSGIGYWFLTKSQRSYKQVKLAYQQARNYKSLNGGFVMACGALSLNIQLGGQSNYHGKAYHGTLLGKGNTASINDINLALKLVSKCAWRAAIIYFTFLMLLAYL